jgi:hypothetical protein
MSKLMREDPVVETLFVVFLGIIPNKGRPSGGNPLHHDTRGKTQ